MELNNEIKKIIHEAQMDDKYEIVSKREQDLEEHLEMIQKHYWTNKTCYSNKCEAIAQQLLMTILKDNDLKEIHSTRYRIKNGNSLLVKYVKKKAMLPDNPGQDYNIEKYRQMSKDNYYKIITDLIGIRILIRYQQQWEIVHRWIWKNFQNVWLHKHRLQVWLRI